MVESHRNCDRVQDAYAMRCLPQVHGAVRDAVAHLREAVEVELNSATDNPLVFPREAERSESSNQASGSDRREAGRGAGVVSVDDRASGSDSAGVLSGGNFHGADSRCASTSRRRADRTRGHLRAPDRPDAQPGRTGVVPPAVPDRTQRAPLRLHDCAVHRRGAPQRVSVLGRPSMDNTPVSGNQEDHVSMSAQSADWPGNGAKAAAILGVERAVGRWPPTSSTPTSTGVGSAEAYDAVRAVAQS